MRAVLVTAESAHMLVDRLNTMLASLNGPVHSVFLLEETGSGSFNNQLHAIILIGAQRQRVKPVSNVENLPWAALFRRFYAEFPRHENPAQAEKTWMKLAPRSADPDAIEKRYAQIIETLRRQLPELRKRETPFIPNPSTWLNAQKF